MCPVKPDSVHRVMLYAEDIRPLREFFETFGLKFEVVVGEDSLAHYITHSGQNTFAICPEHRKTFRPDARATQGLWRYKITSPPA